MVLQDAARYTSHCQCRSSVDMSEPQAKVKQVHHAPLRWQQLTQFLLRGGKEVEKPKSTHRKHSVFMDVLSCCLLHVYCVHLYPCHSSNYLQSKTQQQMAKGQEMACNLKKCGSTCQKIGRARQGTVLHPTSGKICHLSCVFKVTISLFVLLLKRALYHRIINTS